MKATQSTLTLLLFTIGLICLGSGSTQADTVFRDDFSDGSVTNDTPLASDGTPVTWTEWSDGDGGDFDATSGDYVLTTTGVNNTIRSIYSAVVDIALTDTSIRTQVRTSANGGPAFVGARVQNPSVLDDGYFGGIEYDANNGGTFLILGRINGPGNFTFFGDFPVLPFDVRTEDAVLQLDVIGTELKLWGWKAGDPMPDQPQLTATDSTYSGGAIRIANRASENNNIATFRDVHVADMHITDIPEPATLLLAMLGMAGPCCYRRRR